MAADTPFHELEKMVANRDIHVRIDLNSGSAEYCVYTTDLSEQYVEFNKAEYNVATQAT